MSEPVIETERLKMRRHRADDFANCAAMWADPIVTRYIGGKPFTAEESWARLLRYAGHWSLLGFGYWAIEEKSSGRFIGEAGFADFKREIEPSIHGVPELGWALVSGAYDKGYATEAVRAAITWGESNLAARRTVCLIHPENLPSIRVAEKCGFKEYHHTTYKGHPTVLFAKDLTP